MQSSWQNGAMLDEEMQRIFQIGVLKKGCLDNMAVETKAKRLIKRLIDEKQQ